MNSAKEKAALLRPEQAAYTKTSDSNHSTAHGEIIAVIEKNAGEELQVRINEFRSVSYVDLRFYANYAGRRVPTKKGITIPLDLLQPLRDALLKAQVQAVTAADPTAQA